MIDPDDVQRLRDELNALSVDDLMERAADHLAADPPMNEDLRLARWEHYKTITQSLWGHRHADAVEALRDFCFNGELGNMAG